MQILFVFVFVKSCWPFTSGTFNFINFKSRQPLGNFVDTFMDNVVNNVVDDSKYNCVDNLEDSLENNIIKLLVDNSFTIFGTTFQTVVRQL
jgi:hypothetical protein